MLPTIIDSIAKVETGHPREIFSLEIFKFEMQNYVLSFGDKLLEFRKIYFDNESGIQIGD